MVFDQKLNSIAEYEQNLDLSLDSLDITSCHKFKFGSFGAYIFDNAHEYFLADIIEICGMG